MIFVLKKSNLKKNILFFISFGVVVLGEGARLSEFILTKNPNRK